MNLENIVLYDNKKWKITSIIKNKNNFHEMRSFNGFMQVICNRKEENIFLDLKSLDDKKYKKNIPAEECKLYFPEFL